MEKTNLTDSILKWYDKNARDLPWRKTKDPYKIWLSEVILQQTRVAQGLPYYYKFIENFPSVKSLAEASEDNVLLHWQGLGYYSRARNLHTCAKKIIEDYNGIFPNSYESLLKLPGIGEYTAAAISSFAFELPNAAIDGNIIRVISRIFGILHQPHSPESKKEIKYISQELILNNPASTYNQAMMELGALVCTPKKPKCNICPAREHCYAFGNNKMDELPSPKKKINVKIRYFYYLIIENQGNILIEKRTKNDIWRNLYQFPLIESETEIETSEIEIEVQKMLPDFNFVINEISEIWEHKLSHRVLKTRFLKLSLKKETTTDSIISESEFDYQNKNGILEIDSSMINQYAMPQLIRDYLKKNPI